MWCGCSLSVFTLPLPFFFNDQQAKCWRHQWHFYLCIQWHEASESNEWTRRYVFQFPLTCRRRTYILVGSWHLGVFKCDLNWPVQVAAPWQWLGPSDSSNWLVISLQVAFVVKNICLLEMSMKNGSSFGCFPHLCFLSCTLDSFGWTDSRPFFSHQWTAPQFLH